MGTITVARLAVQLRTAHGRLLNVGPNAQILMEAAAAELDSKDAEIERLTAEVELWKDRQAAERQAHEASVKEFDDFLKDDWR